MTIMTDGDDYMRFRTSGKTVYEVIKAGNTFETGFVKPNFVTTDDVPLIKNAIVQMCGMCEVSTIVPDDATDLLISTAIVKDIETWSATHKELFERMHALYSSEYNPLDNYDRTETTTVNSTSTGTSTSNSTSNSNGTSTSNSTTSNVETGTQSSTSDSKSKIMPIDGSGDSDLVTSGGGNNTGAGVNDGASVSDSTTADSTQSKNETATNGSTSSGGKVKTESRIHGNIGVTTAAQMATGERALREAYVSSIQYIASSFKENMTLYYYNI